MKCEDVREFFFQIMGKSITMQVSQPDLEFLSANGYIYVTSSGGYQTLSAELSRLVELNQQLQNEQEGESVQKSELQEDVKKTHSFMFHVEGKEKKEVEIQKENADSAALAKEEDELAQTEAQVNELIQKKSELDRLTPYGVGAQTYLALTGQGVAVLSELNVKMYRLQGVEFTAYMVESKAVADEFQGIVSRAGQYAQTLEGNPDINQST